MTSTLNLDHPAVIQRNNDDAPLFIASGGAMTDPKGLDLGEDRAFQERFWTAERVAWFIMVLIILAALAGLTGHGGPLARATAGGASGEVDYPRITRWEASDEFNLTLPETSGDEAAVEVDSSFSNIFEIEDIQPQPSKSMVTGAGHRLVFELGEPAGSRKITVHVRAMKPSLGTSVDLRLNDGPPLRLRPVVLP
jgi:hypothetical protein